MISVLGVFNADLKFRVARFPKKGETLHGLSFDAQPGGKGFNQAVAAQRASIEGRNGVTMLTQLGCDNFGELAKSVMAEEGLDASHVLESDAMPTGTAMIMVEEPTAENMIVIAPGAASLMDAEVMKKFNRVIGGSSLFITNLEVPIGAAEIGIEIARRNGVKTLLDPAPAQELTPELYQRLDYITPNESEASKLVGFEVKTMEDARRAGDILVSRGVGTAIVTMGKLGIVAVSGSDVMQIDAYEIDKAVDTTGAGDAFNGCFAARLEEGASLVDALKFGAAGAALCVTKSGASQAMARRCDIEEFQKNRTI